MTARASIRAAESACPISPHEPQQNASPFAHVFETESGAFVLDLHTNRLFALSPSEAEVFRKWQAGASWTALSAEYPAEAEAVERLRAEGAFCSQRPEGLAYGVSWDEIRDSILHERSRTVLELTQRCNLRCRYCTFGGGFRDHRTHGTASMDEALLERAVGEALRHGERCDAIAFGFYGGEPLCEPRLLRRAVALARRAAGGKRVSFSLTTNATLLADDDARFLAEEDFSVLVSLDGPRDMHDRYRVRADGRGTHAAALRGLRRLLDAFPSERHARLGLNMVVPSVGWIPRLARLWDEAPWLPRTLRAQAVVMDRPAGLVPDEPPERVGAGQLSDAWLERLDAGAPDACPIWARGVERDLLRLHRRPMHAGPRRTLFPNGCCIPAVRKIHVDVRGTYRICERVHGCPTIGDVRTGVDLERVRALIGEYARRSFDDCAECRAVSTCSLCFADAYEEGAFSLDKKRRACRGVRAQLDGDLGRYVQVAERHPDKIEEWDRAELL